VHREFRLAFASVVALGAVVVVATQFVREPFPMGVVAVAFLALGGLLVAFGFWGADYAFSVRLGELDQSGQGGRFRGERGKVYVPFMRNYTPTEWWNLNWFVVAVGVFCVAFGAYFLGVLLGRLGA
jgi:hypothetical protein